MTDKDHLIAFRDAAAPGEVEAADPRSAHPYELLLRKQQIRLVKPDILKVGLIESYLLFQEFKTFPSYVHFRDQLLKRLKARLPHAQESDASKLKTLIYKAFCFRWDYENTAVKLSAAIRRAEDLIERVYGMIIKRILENTSDEDEIDVPWLSEALFGDNRHGIYVHDRIADYNRRSMEVK